MDPATLDAGPAPTPNTDLDDALSAIDKIGNAPDQPKAQDPAPQPQPTPEPQKASEPQAQDQKPSDPDDLDFGLDKVAGRTKPATQAAQPAQPKPAPAPTPKTPKELREAYEARNKELELTKNEKAAIERKYAELERAKAEGTKKEIEAATQSLNAQLKKIQDERNDLDTRLRFANYQNHPEFKAKFLEPEKEIWRRAMESLKGVEIEGEEGARPADIDDLVSLMGMPEAKAYQAAHTMFGTFAPKVLAFREKIIELQQARKQAIEEYRTKGSEIEAQRAKEQQERETTGKTIMDTSFKEAIEKDPAIFGEDKTDPEGNELITDGEKLVRLAYTGEGLREGLTPEQKFQIIMKARSYVSLRASRFLREVHRNKRLSAKITELEGKLAKIKETEPASGSGSGSKGPTPVDDPDAAFEAHFNG